MKKVILLIMDGLGDVPTIKETPNPQRPNDSAVLITPLSDAKTPNMDNLAKLGKCGEMLTLGEGIIPTSDKAHLTLFGYPLDKYYRGRGPMEAAGAGFELQEGDVAFRANLGTIEDGILIDRRAGRISTKDAKTIDPIVNMEIDGVKVIYKSTVEHRGTLILRGKGLSSKITDTDPHKLNEPVWVSKPKDDSPQAKKTAEIVNKFTKIIIEKLKTHELNKGRELPASVVLLRGAGTYKKVETFKERFNLSAACVSGGALYKGVAKYVGMDVLEVNGATGDLQTNLHAKGKAVQESLRTHDFVFIHVKATDSCGHDGNYQGKKQIIERVDEELIPYLKDTGAGIIITGDHSTPWKNKAHSADPVPILVYGLDSDNVEKFDEEHCKSGSLGKIHGKDVINLILELSKS